MGSTARLVAARGTLRSICRFIEITQQRPKRGLLMMSISGKVRPYRGCLGSMIVMVSSCDPVVSIGVVCWLGFPKTRVANHDDGLGFLDVGTASQFQNSLL